MFKLEEIYFVLNLMSNRFSNITSPLSCLAPATFVYLPQTMAYSFTDFCSWFFLLNVFLSSFSKNKFCGVAAIDYIVHQCYLMIARTVFRDVVISYVVHHLYLRIPRDGVRVYVGYIFHHLYFRISRGGVPVDVVVSDDKSHLSND